LERWWVEHSSCHICFSLHPLRLDSNVRKCGNVASNSFYLITLEWVRHMCRITKTESHTHSYWPRDQKRITSGFFSRAATLVWVDLSSGALALDLGRPQRWLRGFFFF
jgi:hypothetical protein